MPLYFAVFVISFCCYLLREENINLLTAKKSIRKTTGFYYNWWFFWHNMQKMLFKKYVDFCLIVTC